MDVQPSLLSRKNPRIVCICLLISYRERFNKHCSVDSKIQHANLAFSLDGYLWAGSLLVSEKIQIWYVKEMHIELIIPPLTIISVDNGCEGYSSCICTTAMSELTSTIDITVQKDSSIAFNSQFINMTKYGL